MDYSSFYYSIAGCSSTIIAIIGGFIASKLISISSDRDNILNSIKQLDIELESKNEKEHQLMNEINDYLALEFISKNITLLINRAKFHNIYKQEEPCDLDTNILCEYWNCAIKLYDNILNLSISEMQQVNSDDIPIVLAKKYNSQKDWFEYTVYQKIFRELKKRNVSKSYSPLDYYSIVDQVSNHNPTASLWFENKKNDYKIQLSIISDLMVQRELLEEKRLLFKKPKGMLSGLILFLLFSIVGIFLPFLLILLGVNFHTFVNSVIVFILFIVSVLIMFAYMIYLLRWNDDTINHH